jgi:Zn-dependent protease
MSADPYRSAYPPPAHRRMGISGGSLIFPAIVLVTVGAAVATALNTGPIGVWVFLTVLGGWLITLCLHEFGHALTALRGGDTSVRQRGYLTLNPIRYTNVAMTFVIPLFILAIGGIPLPGGAVLIEQHRIRSKAWRSAVSAAGPLVNVAAGIILTLLASTMNSPLAYALSFLALLQFLVAILNLLPVPGLDGWGILAPFLSAKTLAAVRPFTPWAPLVLILLLLSSPRVLQPLWDLAYWIFQGAGGQTRFAAIGSALFHFWR